MGLRRILIVGDEIVEPSALRDELTGLGFDATSIPFSDDAEPPLSDGPAPDLALIQFAPDDGEGRHAIAAKFGERWQIPSLYLISEAGEAQLGWSRGVEPSPYLVHPFSEREVWTGVEWVLSVKDAAQAVGALEERFFTNAIDMLCLLDFSGHFKRLNPAWERTLGFTIEELTSRPFIEFVHPDDRERTLAQNRHVREGGKALGFENRYLCKDGSYRWFHWNATPDSSQNMIYSLARDVTAAKQAEEDRERLLAELTAALAEVRVLGELLPICSYCRKIRDDEDYWHTVEGYVSRHTSTRFTHSICPSCMENEVEPALREFERE